MDCQTNVWEIKWAFIGERKLLRIGGAASLESAAVAGIIPQSILCEVFSDIFRELQGENIDRNPAARYNITLNIVLCKRERKPIWQN